MASPLRSLMLLLAVLAVAWAATTKQGPRMLGGPVEADANEEGVQRALDFAVSEYNKGNNDAYHSRVIQVVRAQKQVRVPAVPCSPGCLQADHTQAPLARARFASDLSQRLCFSWERSSPFPSSQPSSIC